MRSIGMIRSMTTALMGAAEGLPTSSTLNDIDPGSTQGTLLLFDTALPSNIETFLESKNNGIDSGLNSGLNKELCRLSCGAIGVNMSFTNTTENAELTISEAANVNTKTAFIKNKFELPSGQSGFIQTNTTLTSAASLDLSNIEWCYPDYVHTVVGDNSIVPDVSKPAIAVVPGIITPKTEVANPLRYSVYGGRNFSGAPNFEYGRTMLQFNQTTRINRLLFNFKQGRRAPYVVNTGRTSENIWRTGFFYKVGNGAWTEIIAINTRVQSTHHTGYHLIEFPDIMCDQIMFACQPANGNAVQGTPCYVMYNHFVAGYTTATKSSASITPTFAIFVPNINSDAVFASDKTNKFLGKGGGSGYVLINIGTNDNQLQLNKLSYADGQSHLVSMVKPIKLNLTKV